MSNTHKPRSDRHLLVPPVTGSFGAIGVSVRDLSDGGARLRHDDPVEAGSKSVLSFRAAESTGPVSLEALVVWTQPVTAPEESGQYVSGVKIFGGTGQLDRVIDRLTREQRSIPIEERRRSSRFLLVRPIPAEFGPVGKARIEDLSSRGARVETTSSLAVGAKGVLRYSVPEGSFEVGVEAEVVWSSLKAIWSADESRYQAGLRITERHELQRAAIGQLTESGRAIQDHRSLKLKQRIQGLVITRRDGVAVEDRAELIGAVRLELRENTAAGERWLARAKQSSDEPSIRGFAGPIAGNLEALAVWEYLDRTVDPTLIAAHFETT